MLSKRVQIIFKFEPLDTGYLLIFQGEKIACGNMDQVASHIKNFIYQQYKPNMEWEPKTI